MIGALPDSAHRFHSAGRSTSTETFSPRAPEGGEVLVEVAGSALGAAPGREVSGRVVAAGDSASEWLGRRVVVPRVLPCGECDRCRRGRTALCASAAARGGVASHETLPARYLLSVEPPLWPEGVRLAELAALADAAALPYGALVRAQLGPGELCIVVGGGVRGRFATALAKAIGALPIVVEAAPLRAEAALAAGARLVLDGSELDGAAIRDRARAEASALGVPSVELKVIETTGTGAGRRRAIEIAAEGGTAVLCGDGDARDLGAPLTDVANHGGAVLGAPACHPDLYPELAALVVRGELALSTAVQLFPFTALGEALDAARSGRLLRLPVLCRDPAAA